MARCEHRIWGGSDGLMCHRADPHEPGKGCVYWGSTGDYHLDHTIALDFGVARVGERVDTSPTPAT